MLTHLIQSNEVSLFMIDEPDIYLHSDLQRQLLSLLRNLGPDILIATHSTEIIIEAETDDIVLVNKQRKHARRIQRPNQLQEVFSALGSNLNPILTQLAKTRRVVFVEGKDFQILGRLARKLGLDNVGNRSEFAVVSVEGFNPERIRSLKAGMETTLGGRILAAAILDKDFRSEAERIALIEECKSFCDFVTIYEQKEIENFLLVPDAITRATLRKISDQEKRVGRSINYETDMSQLLDDFAVEKKSYVTAQYVSDRRRFVRTISPAQSDATTTEDALIEFERCWKDPISRLKVIPGKDALSAINVALQAKYGVSVTATAIIDAMRTSEIAAEMTTLLNCLSTFASSAAY